MGWVGAPPKLAEAGCGLEWRTLIKGGLMGFGGLEEQRLSLKSRAEGKAGFFFFKWREFKTATRGVWRRERTQGRNLGQRI